MSYGTLTLLGLKRSRSLVDPTTAHFLIGENCVYSCKFCAQAKCSNASPNMLSRVTWPKRSWKDIETSFSKTLDAGLIKRVCLQIVESPGATAEALAILHKIRALNETFPISVCVSPTSVSRVSLFFKAGASRVGLPIDVASSKLYTQIKDRKFEKAWQVLAASARKWPGKISTHLMVGVGETEEEIVRTASVAINLNVTIALFAFTPIKGTPMQKAPAPPLPSYRRIQLAIYCLSNGLSLEQIKFDNGEIIKINILDKKLLDGVLKGFAFQTSGCSHCNRPYYNERPGQIPMNYPRHLSRKEAQRCILQSRLEIGSYCLEDKGTAIK